MASLGTATLELTTDNSRLSSGLKTGQAESEGAFSKIGGAALKMAGVLGVAFGAEKLIEFGVSAVEGAEKLQKSTEVITSTFGPASSTVLQFGEDAAKSFGVSAAEADATSAKFGILFENMGIGQQKAADMTVQWETLAGSLEKVKGVDPSTAMNAMTLAAEGNTRGLKALGIVITSHMVLLQAQRDGYTGTSAAMDTATKSQAILEIAMKQASGTLADAKTHTNDLADQQRVLTAEWSNAKDQLGTALLPALSQVAAFLATNLPVAIDAAKQGFEAIKPTLQALIDDFVGVVDAVRDNWDKIGPIVNDVATMVKDAVTIITDTLRLVSDLLHGDWSAAWNDLKGIVGAALGAVEAAIREQVDAIRAVAETLGQAAYNGISGAISGIAAWVGGEISDAVSAVTNAVGNAAAAAGNFGKSVYNGITGGVTGIVAWLGSQVEALLTAVTGKTAEMATSAKAFGSRVLTGVEDGVTGVVAWLTGQVGSLLAAVTSKADDMLKDAKNFGSSVFDGVKDGTTGVIAWLEGQVGSLLTAVVSKADDMLKDATSFGSSVLRGVESGVGGVVGWLKGVASDLVAAVSGEVGSVLSAATRFGGAIVDGIGSGLKSLGDTLSSWIVDPINKVIGELDGIRIPGFHVSIPIPSIDTHIPGIGKIGGGDIGFGFDGLSPFSIPKLETGGLILEAGLAFLHPGEVVTPAAKVDRDYDGGQGGDIVLQVGEDVFGRISRRAVIRHGARNGTLVAV